MFENIIGYEAEKLQLAKVCDFIRNQEYYTSLGVETPKGVLLYGEPGVGKTTFANDIIAECGRPSFVIRKNGDTPTFIQYIKDTFEEARKQAPSVILLDDVDKFGDGNAFSPEYTSLQGIMDDNRQYNIFVIATANEAFKLPPSLTRPGRFDIQIEFFAPNKVESKAITEHYLRNRNISPNVNIDTISTMLMGSSCATLESVINLASLSAAFERSPFIETRHLVDSILTTVYKLPKTTNSRTPDELYMSAVHEAGHAVVQATMDPSKLTFVTIRQTKHGKPYEITKDVEIKLWDGKSSLQETITNAMVLLGGKVAVEMRFGTADMTATNEVKSAMSMIKTLINDCGVLGFEGMTTFEELENMYFSGDPSEVDAKGGDETIKIIEALYYQDKTIVVRNWVAIEQIAVALIQNETLTRDDILAIMNGGCNYISNGRFAGLITG